MSRKPKGPVNKNCYIELSILEANFLKDDGDVLGKQDPFIQFHHNGVLLKTKTAEDAGKHAKYTDELFTLEDLESAITKNEMITFNAMDEDATGADLLAVAKPLPIT